MLNNTTSVITAWNVISSLGLDRETFTENMLSRTVPVKQSNSSYETELPPNSSAQIHDFETRDFLGKKGTRYLDRMTGLSIAAVKGIFDDKDFSGYHNSQQIGFVLGTSMGSTKSVCDFNLDTFGEFPHLVNPAIFPNAVMNFATGQAAIWFKKKGLNATVSGGHGSGLLALSYADTKLKMGHSDQIIAGSSEDFCEYKAWGYYLKHAKKTNVPFGEGSAFFSMESKSSATQNDRKILAELVGKTFVSTLGKKHNVGDTLNRCIVKVLSKAGVDAKDVMLVSKHHCAEDDMNRAEDAAIEQALNGSEYDQISISDLVGNTYSASFSFQVASVLGQFGRNDKFSDKYALITSLSPANGVGCALLKAPRSI